MSVNTKVTTKYILGVKVDFGLNLYSVVSFIGELLAKAKVVSNEVMSAEDCHLISTTNPEFIMSAQQDPTFKTTINTSVLSLPDGVGVVFARHFLEKTSEFEKDFFYPVRCFLYGLYLGSVSFFRNFAKERISGVDLVDELCALAEKENYNVFLLGGWPKDFWGRNLETQEDLASAATENLKGKYPGLNVVGATSQFSYKKQDDEATLAYIKDCMTSKRVSSLDILFVAYGHIRQEGWIARNSGKIPARISVGVGGTFDYIANVKKRPPKLLRTLNLAWLYRFITQPWRISRIFTVFPSFPLRIFIFSVKNP